MKTFLLCALLAGSIGAWADSELTPNSSQAGSSNDAVVRTSYTIPGACNPGGGSSNSNWSNRYMKKIRTNQTLTIGGESKSNCFYITVNSGYIITGVSLYMTTNKSDESNTLIATYYDNATKQSGLTTSLAKVGASSPTQVSISGISATERVVLQFSDTKQVLIYGTIYYSKISAASAPSFSPNGGDINGGSSITLGGSALHAYYQWSDTEVTLTKDSEGWTEGKSVTAPNVTGTKYLYAYATNGTGYESAVVSKTFNITKVKLANGMAYATTAVTKKVGYAAFTNTLTNPNELAVTYSIADGATATGTTVNETTGEVTLGETAGTATIKATFAGNDDYVAGEVSYTLTLNAATVQADVTGNKTWDIENNVSSDADRHTDGTYKVYDNIEGLYFGAEFDATSLLVKATSSNTAYRKQYKCAQGASLKFHATIPGLVTVKFGSPGKDARTLAVNGNEVFSSVEKTTASWYVEAGDVEITGVGSIRVFNIVFNTVSATNINLNASGYATFSTNYPVEVSGAKAYTAALDYANEKITCTEITGGKVPAGAGVLLFGEPNAEVTLTPTTGATALAGNNLKATTLANGIAATKGENNYYVLSGDTFKKFTGDAFAANKAYFEVDGEDNVLARGFNIVFVDEATGINEVGNAELDAEEYYNLSGQRVVQPTNGLYIVNGKKVIIK